MEQELTSLLIQILFAGLENCYRIFLAVVVREQRPELCGQLQVILVSVIQPDLHDFAVLMDVDYQTHHAPFQ